MALKISKTLDNGLIAPDAYARIIDCRFGKRNQITISVHFFTDENARRARKPSIHGASYNFDYDTQALIADATGDALTPYAYCYDLLKLHNDFAGATDVLP